MAREEDEIFGRPKSAPAAHVVGEALDALSVEELAARIAILRAEIERLEAARVAKDASRAAAAAFFK
jgi:uncharacterized small protein (DUF1192 family)